METDGVDSDDGLPPRRVFVPPAQPREVIQRRAEAAAAKLRRAKEKGANVERLRRVEAEAEDLARKLRDAGGPTPTSLLFQIKGEEKRKVQAARAIEQLQKRIADEEEEIVQKRAAIDKLHKAVERHEERLQTAERRLVYLTTQKLSENIPLGGVAELRASFLALAAGKDQKWAPILALVAAVVPPEVHYMEDGETSDARTEGDGGGGGDEEVTEEEMDEDGPSRNVDWDNLDGQYVQRVHEAREELQRVQREMHAAVEGAAAAQRESNKRPLGGDGPKELDEAGDIAMVPSLTPAQVEDSFRGRVREAADRYRHAQQLAAKEVVRCGGEGRSAQQQQQEPAAGCQRSVPNGEQGTGSRAAADAEAMRGPRQRAASSGGGRPAAACIARWQTDEEREEERGRWRAGGKGARGRSPPRQEGGRERAASVRRSGGLGRSGGGAAPVTPVDPVVAMQVCEEIERTRGDIASRMEQVVLQVEANAAAELIRKKVDTNAAIQAQERMQLLQEAEFAAACSRRATNAGLQTAQQRDQVRSIWVADMARVGEAQLAEEAFATYDPSPAPLEELQDRALRRAGRRANLGDAADRGHVGGGGKAEPVGDARGQGHEQTSAEGEAGSGRSRSKSPRPRGGTRARRE